MPASDWSRAPQRGLQIAFGVDEEVCGCDDAIAFADAAFDFDETFAASADLDLPRLETSLALIDDHHLTFAGVDDRTVGHGQNLFVSARCDLDIRIHVGA